MSREIKIEEVKLHNNEKSVWMIIHNEVYDVTKFLHEHPGGADSLLDYAGQDGTQGFEDVGHSDDAREMMKQFKIGILPAEQRNTAINVIPDVTKKKEPSALSKLNKDVVVLAASPPESSDSSSNLKWALLALAGAIVIGVVLKKYMG